MHASKLRRLPFALPLCVSAIVGLSACSNKPAAECNPFVDPACKHAVDTDTNEGGGLETLLPADTGDLPQGSSGGSGDDVCDVEKIPAQIQAANVMLVLDKSGSMSKNKWSDGGVDRTRWESLYKTVAFMVDEFDKSARFGMKLFPAKTAKGTENACLVDPGVEVPIADNNGAAVLAGMPSASTFVEGGTPASTGYRYAVEYLKGLAAAGDPRRRIIILVMDGRVADCEDTHQDLLGQAADALANGITTFVVGIDVDTTTPDGFQLHSDLRVLAVKGGSGTYFDSSDPQRLRAAMEEIIDQISDCRIKLSKPPLQPNWATVEVANQTFRWLGQGVASCEAANLPAGQGGFTYVDIEGQNGIELCGQACTNYVKSGAVKVNLLCEPPQ